MPVFALPAEAATTVSNAKSGENENMKIREEE
jgi:hypothetical protein